MLWETLLESWGKRNMYFFFPPQGTPPKGVFAIRRYDKTTMSATCTEHVTIIVHIRQLAVVSNVENLLGMLLEGKICLLLMCLPSFSCSNVNIVQ